MIKVILFDIDGVLVDSRGVNFQFIKKLFAINGYKFISKDEYVKNYYHLTGREVIEKIIPDIGKENLEKMLISRKTIPYIHKKSDLPINEINTLKILKQKYLLGLVTGRTKSGVESYFRVANLEPLFAVVSSYEDYSKPKPDPEPLQIALQKLKINADEAIFIGDSYIDLQAAKALGMKFIGFYGVSGNQFSEADANVKSFSELAEAIEKLT